VEAAETIGELARTGKLRGLAFICLFKRGRYIVNVAGDCHADPTLTRGMLGALDDQLKKMIHTSSFDDTQL